jgi:hypothetical protein
LAKTDVMEERPLHEGNRIPNGSDPNVSQKSDDGVEEEVAERREKGGREGLW